MRLIDAETFSEAMKAYFINKIENHEAVVDVVDCNAELQKILSEQPTAYDVEKVLNKLEEAENNAMMRTGNWEDDDPYYDGEVNAYRHAMGIARRGATP